MKRLEKLVLVALLLLCFLTLGVMAISKPRQENANIAIKVDNKLVKEIPLNYSGDSKIYSFNFSTHTGYIESKNGKVRILELPKDLCPDGICAKTGWIDKDYQSIVCLPNKIVITVEGTGSKSNIDVIP